MTSSSLAWLIPILSILLGVCTSFIVPATQASAKELLGSMAVMGISMQLSIMGLGTFLAPIISAGYLVPMGWNAAFYAIALWCVRSES
jgi:MFS family permease